ncbi:hypothetical protein K7X08_038078 [Anisodus acutangulus]|uniref:Uncharacterized protein n=1 Tax=Anisodus acutangulus TaxID=402998 RepID=A0A9Q1RSM7_9SOLA|nr:hypothetical protein K7X08_038078 [Anisodus acutangulus]
MAPHIGQSFNRFQDSSDVHEAMMREIEKELIRDDIIAEEVARRRMLEFEVRRELMMEREVEMWRGDHRFASLSFPPRLPFLKQQADTSVFELGTRHDMNRFKRVIAEIILLTSKNLQDFGANN